MPQSRDAAFSILHLFITEKDRVVVLAVFHAKRAPGRVETRF